ncbi:MAG: hypothetical protein ACHREM_13880 [Polyangiales bacterium]
MAMSLALGSCGGLHDASSGAPDASTTTVKAAVSRATEVFSATPEGAFVVSHVAQRWTATIDPHGATLRGAGDAWTLGLHATRIGRAGSMRSVDEAIPELRGHRASIARSRDVTEWYSREARGLEQGFEVNSRPSGESELVIDVAVDALTPVARGQVIELRDARDRGVLFYGELAVQDANGRELSASMSVVGDAIELRIDDAKARYPIVVDPLIWLQQQELTLSSGGKFDGLGTAVAVDGATALVGAPGRYSGSGAAYVFAHVGTTWTQFAELAPSDASTGGVNFGTSVSLSGAIGVVGGSQTYEAYVFEPSGTIWAQTAKLAPSGGDGAFGSSVAIDGGTVLIGSPAPVAPLSYAYVFTQSGSTWVQAAMLSSTINLDYFGESVSIRGSTALIGAPGNATSGVAGAAFVFSKSGAAWTQTAKLLPIGGATLGHNFGGAVALDGAIAIVSDSANNSGTGAAYVFTESGSTWTQSAKLLSTDGATNDYFGSSVSLSGNTALIGASGKNSSAGAAYVFTLSGAMWTQTAEVVPSGAARDDTFGSAVSISGDVSLVGANQFPASGPGKAYVFSGGAANGDACSLPTDCASMNCTDGVCCNTACTGACNACVTSRTGGADGICAVVSVPSKCSACAADADCSSVHAYCASTTCTVLLTNGALCTAANQCASTYCADGVCCATACAGSRCQACASKLTGQADGTCAPATGGTDPHSDCPGTNCTSGTLTIDACNGAGSCSSTPTSCAPYSCTAAGNACATSCKVDSDCGTNAYCSAGTCAARSTRGGPCATTNQCALGSSCADGVCCDQPCTGQCQACAEPGSIGTCVAVKGTPRAPRTACIGTDAACTGVCDGTNFAACAYPNAGRACGAGCSGEQIAVCDSTGKCLAPTPCPGSFLCDAPTNQCKTSCLSSADCVTGNGCDPIDHQCKPIQSTCSADRSTSIPGDPSQASVACSPFLCDSTSGRCFSSCTSTNECASGFTCDTTSSSAPCIPVTSGTNSAGGGCAVGSSSSGGGGLIGFALTFVVVATRRRSRTAPSH